jgi:isoquinoline 1-oxidoreductase beta subunit
LHTAAEMAQWGNPIPAGRGRGLAFAERSGSLGACVCELSVDPATGKIKVHHLWSALDCGVVVQPDNVIAQMEGGFIMGLSSVLKERISFQNGVVQQSNFHDYPILRFNEIPESIEVKLIDSQENPTGVGESAVPLVGGAVANAFGSLTGKRLRHLPFTPDKVLAVL